MLSARVMRVRNIVLNVKGGALGQRSRCRMESRQV